MRVNDVIPEAPEGVQIADRAMRVVESMRAATEARNDSQRKAADFIREQAERLAGVEAELAATRVERDGLRSELQATVADAEAARNRHDEEARAAAGAHREELERVVKHASEEIARIRAWKEEFTAETQDKQGRLERDNGRLALESERMGEEIALLAAEGERLAAENAVLSQVAETLIDAAGESAAALQRQEAAFAETLRLHAPRGEGNLVHLHARPRAEAPAASGAAA